MMSLDHVESLFSNLWTISGPVAAGGVCLGQPAGRGNLTSSECTRVGLVARCKSSKTKPPSLGANSLLRRATIFAACKANLKSTSATRQQYWTLLFIRQQTFTTCRSITKEGQLWYAQGPCPVNRSKVPVVTRESLKLEPFCW